MQIVELEYLDKQRNIRLAGVNFSRLNVLKGKCGSGKSTVIDGIYTLTRIAQGAVSPDDSWKLTFIDLLGRKVVWSGQFGPSCSETMQRFRSGSTLAAALLSESIFIDDALVFERFDEHACLSGRKVNLEGRQYSALKQFVYHSDLKIVAHSIASIAVYHHDSMVLDNPQVFVSIDAATTCAVGEYFNRKPKSSIAQLHHNFIELDCREKIYFAYLYDRTAFTRFEQLYGLIYPQVAQILPRMIETHTSDYDSSFGSTYDSYRDVQCAKQGVLLAIRLTDGRFIEQGLVSAGMFKTMMVLANSMFSSPHALLVYDGLESGLDKDCLSYLFWSMQALSNQHIIASHSSDIDAFVNSDEQKWVIREGNVISFACDSTTSVNSVGLTINKEEHSLSLMS